VTEPSTAWTKASIAPNSSIVSAKSLSTSRSSSTLARTATAVAVAVEYGLDDQLRLLLVLGVADDDGVAEAREPVGRLSAEAARPARDDDDASGGDFA
jgi:hypothetical protein